MAPASPSAPTYSSFELETSSSCPSSSLLPPRTSSLSPSYSSSASTPSVLSSPPPPSLYVTFKVLRLVNSFCKRVRTRVRSPASEGYRTKARRDLRRELDREAYDEIDRYLGRKPSRACKPAPKATTILAEYQEPPLPKDIQCMLSDIDLYGESSYPLDAVAKSNRLFLERNTDFHAKHMNLTELTRLLVSTRDLLDTFKPSHHHHHHQRRPAVRILCEGTELLDADDTYIGNLHHLLLCLYHQLLQLLIERVLELAHRHLVDCQKDQDKHGEVWFFEFPDARHPLSTTWPWSIRPSLAVIWGVCWMFWDCIGSLLPEDTKLPAFMIDAQGDIVLENSAVQKLWMEEQREQNERRQQERRRRTYVHARDGETSSLCWKEVICSSNRFRRHLCITVSARLKPTKSLTMDVKQVLGRTKMAISGIAAVAVQNPRALATALTRIQVSITAAMPMTTLLAGVSDAFHPALDTQPAATSTYHTTLAAPTSAAQTQSQAQLDWLPEDRNFVPNVPDLGRLGYTGQHSQPAFPGSLPADQGAWTLRAPSGRSGFGIAVPGLPQTPIIRVSTDLAAFPKPEDHSYQSAVSSASSYHHSNSDYGYHPGFNHHLNSQNLSPHTRSFMSEPRADMNTPVSPVSPRPQREGNNDSILADQIVNELSGLSGRKRSHSVMSQGGLQQQHGSTRSRAGSATSIAHPESTSPAAAEDFPLRGSHSFKRGDPPVNENSKFYCDFSSDCKDITFDRKCEWSKHMDKHDRPYRCPHPACAKLQGFTYSGGLLRHEREVHGKHGGPKAQLMCPHGDCKRHSGKGFTRKENLNEHIRRVHEIKPQAGYLQSAPLRRETMDTTQGVEEMVETETPASRLSDLLGTEDFATSPAASKRKRSLVEEEPPNDVDSLALEVKRLRADNKAKERRMQMMEEADARREGELRQLKETLMQIQQGQPVTAQTQQNEDQKGRAEHE